MNPVSLGLDGLLALLLVAALTVGSRLNAKLKSLKDSQAGFVKAVADLDLAAGRAEAGLAALRAATEEAHDALLTRIETARTLSARLDRASEDARTAVSRLEVAAHRAERAATAPPAPAAAPPPLRLVDPVSTAPVSTAPVSTVPDETALLRLIEAARGEAQVAHADDLGARRPPAQAVRPAPAPDPAADRLARFVARRRQARSA